LAWISEPLENMPGCKPRICPISSTSGMAVGVGTEGQQVSETAEAWKAGNRPETETECDPELLEATDRPVRVAGATASGSLLS
jgi:hypothetical protein